MDGLSDDRLVEELRRAAGRFDPVPAIVDAAARAAYTWRTIDAELAQLTWDSADREDALAGVRGVGTARLLTFETPAIVVDVEVTETGDVRRLLGQVQGALQGPVSLELRHAGGVTPVDIDDLGRFVAEGVRAGAVSLRCRCPSASAGQPVVVDTTWVAI